MNTPNVNIDEPTTYSVEEKQFLAKIRSIHAQQSRDLSLADIVDDLLEKLEHANNEKKPLKLYEDLDYAERDAAEVLIQSGEAILFRDENHHICIKINKPSLFKCLLTFGMTGNC